MISRSAVSHGRFVMFAVTVPITPLEGRMVRPVNAANTPSTSLIGAFSQFTVMRGSCDCFLGAAAAASRLAGMAVLGSGLSCCGGSAAATGAGAAACCFGACSGLVEGCCLDGACSCAGLVEGCCLDGACSCASALAT